MTADESAVTRPSEEVISKGGLAGWQMRAILRLTDTSLPTLTVARMAAIAGLSAHHFSRAFRATMGMPPREWLLQKRLEKAQLQLLATDETVDGIATGLGYKSGSQLSRIFRARFGMSPQAFRRR